MNHDDGSMRLLSGHPFAAVTVVQVVAGPRVGRWVATLHLGHLRFDGESRTRTGALVNLRRRVRKVREAMDGALAKRWGGGRWYEISARGPHVDEPSEPE